LPGSKGNLDLTAAVNRSQWPRGLRHEMSTPAWTLGLWVRIPLKEWMSVRVYSVFVLGSGLVTGWSPVQEVLQNVLDQETEVKRSVSRMPYAPRASNRNSRRRRSILCKQNIMHWTLDFSQLLLFLRHVGLKYLFSPYSSPQFDSHILFLYSRTSLIRTNWERTLVQISTVRIIEVIEMISRVILGNITLFWNLDCMS
jgi:hypothetical protein